MRRIFRSAFAHPCRRSLADTREPVKSHFGANPATVTGGRTARPGVWAWQIGIGLRSATPGGKVLGDVCIDGHRLGDVRLAALGIALLDFRHPAAKERLGPLGFEPQRRVIVGDCEIVVPAVAVRDGAAVKGKPELGIETQRLRIIGKRALGEPKRTGAVQRRAQSRLLRASQALGQSMVDSSRSTPDCIRAFWSNSIIAESGSD